MFTIDADKTISLTRGDMAVIKINATTQDDESYIFQPGDVVCFRIFQKSHHELIVLQKEVVVENETESVDISLTGEDTKIGEFINKPKDYWYEIELNPDTVPQTIIGYDNEGPKVFRLYPEGDDLSESTET